MGVDYKYCPYCGQETYEQDARYCPSCGKAYPNVNISPDNRNENSYSNAGTPVEVVKIQLGSVLLFMVMGCFQWDAVDDTVGDAVDIRYGIRHWGPFVYSKMVYPCEGYLCAYTVCYFRYLR